LRRRDAETVIIDIEDHLVALLDVEAAADVGRDDDPTYGIDLVGTASNI
jgi:hypothetical protein